MKPGRAWATFAAVFAVRVVATGGRVFEILVDMGFPRRSCPIVTCLRGGVRPDSARNLGIPDSISRDFHPPAPGREGAVNTGCSDAGSERVTNTRSYDATSVPISRSQKRVISPYVRTHDALKRRGRPLAVTEGDQQTSLDADRIRATGTA